MSSIKAPVNPTALALSQGIQELDRRTKGSVANLAVPSSLGQVLNRWGYGESTSTPEKLFAALDIGGGPELAKPLSAIFLAAKSHKNQKLVAEALKRLGGGEDAAKVWKETGIGKEPVTGTPLYEIDDSKMKFKKPPTDEGDWLRNVVHHPELYDAAPDLAARVDAYRGGQGGYRPSTYTMTLPTGNKGTAIHEMNHAAAQDSGLSPGANPTQFTASHGEDAMARYIDELGEGMSRLADRRRTLSPSARADQYPFEPNYFANETGSKLEDLQIRNGPSGDAASIGPVYRGGVDPEHLDLKTFFSKNPEYAELYAKGMSTEEIDMADGLPEGAAMGQYMLPDEKLFDARNEPELMDKFGNWWAEKRSKAQKEYADKFPNSPRIGFTDDVSELKASMQKRLIRDGLPDYDLEDELLQYLDEAGRDWDTALFHESVSPEDIDLKNPADFSVGYRVKDPETAKMVFGLKNFKEPKPSAIGPLYRGAESQQALDEGGFFTESPEYAENYGSVMGKFELPSEGHVDFTKDPELRAQWVKKLRDEWNATTEGQKYKDDWAFSDGSHPGYEDQTKLAEFLNTQRPDWSSAKVSEYDGMQDDILEELGQPSYSYMTRDPKIARNLLSEGLRKKPK